MRELKKVTVNVANVELYCREDWLKCNTANHVCPSPSQVMYNARHNSADTACFIVNKEMRGASIEFVAGMYLRNVLYSDTFCWKTKAAYGHFLMDGRMYCMYYELDDNGVWCIYRAPRETTGC